VRTLQQQARFAGLLYLLVAVCAPFGLLYVPGKLIVSGDAAATAERIRGAESLLRWGIASELAHQALAVFVVFALYRLFEPVDKGLARLLVALGALVSVPIMFVNVLNDLAALVLARGTAWLAVFERPQLDALAYLFLHLHGKGITVASVFWGLWLFPFGLLVLRSRFIPRVFGYLLMVAGSAYLVAAFAELIVPAWLPVVSKAALPLEAAEVPVIFWLAIRGARPRAEAAA